MPLSAISWQLVLVVEEKTREEILMGIIGLGQTIKISETVF
jgi:hypothetical protein